MSRVATVREAMIAEMVGDITELLERMETLTGAMNDSRKKLADTDVGMTSRAESLEAHLIGSATLAERTTLDSIATRTRQMGPRSATADGATGAADEPALPDQSLSSPASGVAVNGGTIWLARSDRSEAP